MQSFTNGMPVEDADYQRKGYIADYQAIYIPVKIFQHDIDQDDMQSQRDGRVGNGFTHTVDTLQHGIGDS